MTETASLVIKVDSSGAKTATGHLKDLERAAGSNERQAHKLGKAWGVATGLISSAAIIGATTGYLKLADTWALMNARLGMVTKSSGELKQVQGDLFKLAQESRTSLEGVTDLYVKLANSSDELRNNQSLLIGVTTNVSKALTLSGADAASATAVIRQFSQAMATGTLRGDEFVSVMEGAPRLARAIADGLKVPVGALRELAAQGKLTSDVVIQALESQGQVIDREFRNMPLTVSGAVQKVRNSMQQMIGDTDQASGASQNLAQNIDDLASLLASEKTRGAFATMVGGVVSVTTAVVGLTTAITESMGRMQEWLNLRQNLSNGGSGGGAPTSLKRKQLEELDAEAATRRNGRRDTRPDPIGKLLGLNGSMNDNDLARRRRELKQSIEMDELTGLDDQAFKMNWRGPVTASERATGRSAIPRATGGGSAASRRERATATRELTAAEKEWLEFEKELLAHEELANDARRDATNAWIQSENEKQDAIDRGQAATAELIQDMEFELSLIGKSNVEREKAVALRYADKDATAAQREQIAGLAEDLAKAREAETYVNDIKSATTDFATQALSDYKRAGDAAQDYAERLKQIAIRMLAEKAIQWLFSTFMGGGATGGTGSAWAFGSNTYGNNNFGTGGTFGWGGGRATGGSVSRRSIYEVGEGGKPELLESDGRYYLLPGNDGRVSPAGRGGGSSAPPQVNVNIHNAPAGADVRQKKNPMGGIDIDVIFKQFEGKMAANLAGGSGPMGAAMKGRFNIGERV